MSYYSEFPLLVYTGGRCAMDEFFIEEFEEQEYTESANTGGI